MGYYSDITAGVGAFLGGGFLTLEGAAVSQVLPAVPATVLQPLSYVLYAAGFIFIGAGIIERFFTGRMGKKSDAETAADAAK